MTLLARGIAKQEPAPPALEDIAAFHVAVAVTHVHAM
jgi:hypothetical protein